MIPSDTTAGAGKYTGFLGEVIIASCALSAAFSGYIVCKRRQLFPPFGICFDDFVGHLFYSQLKLLKFELNICAEGTSFQGATR
jgi:hypothetical protein